MAWIIPAIIAIGSIVAQNVSNKATAKNNENQQKASVENAKASLATAMQNMQPWLTNAPFQGAQPGPRPGPLGMNLAPGSISTPPFAPGQNMPTGGMQPNPMQPPPQPPQMDVRRPAQPAPQGGPNTRYLMGGQPGVPAPAPQAPPPQVNPQQIIQALMQNQPQFRMGG